MPLCCLELWEGVTLLWDEDEGVTYRVLLELLGVLREEELEEGLLLTDRETPGELRGVLDEEYREDEDLVEEGGLLVYLELPELLLEEEGALEEDLDELL